MVIKLEHLCRFFLLGGTQGPGFEPKQARSFVLLLSPLYKNTPELAIWV
jgi:hypothetical protein